MTNAIYLYDAAGFYVGTGVADPDPLQTGKWLLPIGSTLTAPPAAGTHEATRFNGEAWEVVSDFQGMTYWIDGAQRTMEARGVALPLGATLTKPQTLIDAEEAAVRARTFTFIDNMNAPALEVPVLADQAELDRLTLQYQQAKLAGVAALVSNVSGKDYTFTISGFEELLTEYAQTMTFHTLRGTGIMQSMIAALNTATAAELKTGSASLPVLGSKDAKVAGIQISNHAEAFKVAFPDPAVTPESNIITWVIGQRSVPFVVGV